MRIDWLWIGEYKNLKDLLINFDQNHWVTVLIGWNGTGKSNVIEALTVVAACNLLQELGHSKFDNLMLLYDLDSRVDGGNKQDKATKLAKIALGEPDCYVETSEGLKGLQEAVIRKAIALPPVVRRTYDWGVLSRGLNRDGFNIVEDDSGTMHLLRMHPNVADIQKADDEVHLLLKEYQFTTPLGHLEQAIKAHARGDWASANSQLRTFLEGLFDDIVFALDSEKVKQALNANARRQLLANMTPPFFSRDLNEWADGQKQALVPGLMNRLHPEGSHPGLSDEEDSTFRLHIVLIAARLFLRRFRQFKSMEKSA